jgi:RimJ/RimL family protein N-acetyltransferase
MLTVEPLPLEQLGQLWEWLREFPQYNFDDYGPRDVEAFRTAIEGRLAAGEAIWGVRLAEEWVGAIGFLPTTGRTGMLRGVVFPRGKLSRHQKRAAVSLVLAELFASGVEKVLAAAFADNRKIRQFLLDLGAVEEGYLKRQTMRGGTAIDMRLVAIFKEGFLCHSVAR